MTLLDQGPPQPTVEAVAARLGGLPLGMGGWSLTRLALADCWIGDAGMAALARALANAPALQHLDVRMNAQHSAMMASGAPPPAAADTQTDHAPPTTTTTPEAATSSPLRVEWMAQGKAESGLCEGW